MAGGICIFYVCGAAFVGVWCDDARLALLLYCCCCCYSTISLYWYTAGKFILIAYIVYTPCCMYLCTYMSLVSELEIRIYGVPKVHTACPCVFKHTCQSYMHIHNGWMTLNTCMPPLTPLSLPSVYPYIMLLIYLEQYGQGKAVHTHTHARHGGHSPPYHAG